MVEQLVIESAISAFPGSHSQKKRPGIENVIVHTFSASSYFDATGESSS